MSPVGPSRREFIRYCAVIASALGLSKLHVPRIAQALERLTAGRTRLIWLQGQSCGGCTLSLLNSESPNPADLIIQALSLKFHPMLELASGSVAMRSLEQRILGPVPPKSEGPKAERSESERSKSERSKADPYVLVLEGALPLAEEGAFGLVGDARGKKVPLPRLVLQAARNAEAVIAFGTCAAYGGISDSAGSGTGAAGLSSLAEDARAGAESSFLGGDAAEADSIRTINIPGCPPRPDRFIATLVKLQLVGTDKVLSGLDRDGRPREFYGRLVHDDCPRRAAFDAGRFATDFNDAADSADCLLLKGCKGPVTHADCPSLWYNGGTNFCVEANSPCIGCTEPGFYERFSPVYSGLTGSATPVTGAVRRDTAGAILAGAAVLSAGIHLIGRFASGRAGVQEPQGQGQGQDPQEAHSRVEVKGKGRAKGSEGRVGVKGKRRAKASEDRGRS